MTGLELFKAPGTTAVEIADIVSNPCPPVVPEVCDKFSCRECWQAWLETGKPPKEKGSSDKQTTPDEEGLHPNLVEMYAKAHRRARRTLHDQAIDGSAVTPPPPLETDAQQ